MTKQWQIPYYKGRYEPYFWMSWKYHDEIEWRDPVDFEATLQAVDWGSSRATGYLIFEAEDGAHYEFTVKDVLEMMPHIYAGRIKGTFGWKKQGTAIWNTLVAPAPDWPPEVLIEVEGGVADVTEQPDWITVEIRDHDNEEI